MLAQIDPRTPSTYIVQGDIARAVDVQLTDECQQTPIDLTLATSVTMNRKHVLTGSISRHSCSLLDATQGKVRCLFNAGQTDVTGDYLVSFTVTWPGAITDTYPKHDYSNILLRITPKI